GLFLAVLVEEARVGPPAVLVGGVEDVADVVRGLERERTAALRAAVALHRLAQVDEARLVVAPGLDAAQMEAVLVGARDELAALQCQVGDDLAREANRPEGAAGRAERPADLVVRRGTRADPERREQLRLRQPVVAADEREDDTAVLGRRSEEHTS